MPKTVSEILEALQAPTPPTEIRYIPRGPKADGNSTNSGKAVAIPYVGSEFVEGRLDQACGPFGWQSQIMFAGNTIAVGVGIINPETNEWLWRWDVGKEGDADTEHGEKAEVTAALKRAARQWGVGRDLKDIPKLNVKCEIYKQGDKVKFSRWSEDPWQTIQRFLTSRTTTKPGNGNAQADPGAAKSSAPAVQVESQTVSADQAKKIVFDFMMLPMEKGGVGYETVGSAIAWIKQQEAGLGKTVEAYQTMYNVMLEKTKPPKEAA